MPHNLNKCLTVYREGLSFSQDFRQLHDRFRRLLAPPQRRRSVPRRQALLLPPRLPRLGQRPSSRAFPSRPEISETFRTLRTFGVGEEEEHVAHFRRLSRIGQLGRLGLHLSLRLGHD